MRQRRFVLLQKPKNNLHSASLCFRAIMALSLGSGLCPVFKRNIGIQELESLTTMPISNDSTGPFKKNAWTKKRERLKHSTPPSKRICLGTTPSDTTSG